MDTLAFLNVLLRHLPNMSLDTALIIATDAAETVTPAMTTEDYEKRSTEDSQIVGATLYAYTQLDSDSVRNYKIRSIKALRENFPGLSLRAAKSIIDKLAEQGSVEEKVYELPIDEGQDYDDEWITYEDDWGPIDLR